jgi:fucose permease
VLEGFKDLPIAIVSFLVASTLPRFGYKKAMLLALAIVAVATLAMPLVPAFATAKLLFLCVGVAFALAKVSVYSTIGLVARDRKHHASITNMLEGFFMVGVLSAYWIFGFFIDSDHPESTSWLNVYWLLSGLCAATFLLVLSTSFNEYGAVVSQERGPGAEFVEMLRLLVRPLVCVFVVTAFLSVVIEQSIGSWLPTFNNEILKLPATMSVQVTSIFAGSLAVGRLSAGVIMRRLNWYPVLSVCMLAMGATVLLALPLTHGIAHDPNVTWATAPVAAFLFPLIGLFMAPIYPGINSVMLSSLPRHQHAPMTGLLVIFSALGGTTGSLITGYVFGHFNGHFAFYLTLVPIVLMLGSLYAFKRQVERNAAEMPVTVPVDGTPDPLV